MATTKNEALKDLMSNVGTFLILAGAAAMKADTMTFLLLGLVLLVVRMFDMKSLAAGKQTMMEIILSGAVVVAAIAQLSLAKRFTTTQFFMILVLLGGVLVAVEAFRKNAER